MKRIAALVATSSLAIGATGCGLNATPNATGMNKVGGFNALARRKAERGGKWTVLVHLGADNNLYRFGLEDMNEMEAGLASDDVDVIVLFDGIKNGDSAIYKIKRDPAGLNGNIISEKLNDGNYVVPASGEIDSGDVKVATRFVEWAAKAYPADHTFLGYWDHGSGLFNNAPNPITKGIVWDDNGSNMTTADMGSVTGAFKAAAGKPLSVLGFDACLMAHGEIAYQVAGNANYMVAAEELEPGKGWDYRGWLGAVAKLPSKTPAAVSTALVESFHASYQPGGSQTSGRDQTTLSAVDVNAFAGNVVPALNAFVEAANANMGAEKAAFQAARAKAQTFYNKDCADLGSFLANVKSSTRSKDVATAATRLQAAYASSIVAEQHTKHFPGATGLVLYFPTPSQRLNPVYNDPNKIAFARTAWKDFLKNYR